jgi:hypothetical protein
MFYLASDVSGHHAKKEKVVNFLTRTGTMQAYSGVSSQSGSKTVTLYAFRAIDELVSTKGVSGATGGENIPVVMETVTCKTAADLSSVDQKAVFKGFTLNF